MLLALDTCGPSCGVALLSPDRGVLSRAQKVIGRGHAEHLMPLMEELMQTVDCAYRDLTRIGVTTGPGSFTGVRVGLSVARGLGFALGIDVVGVSALDVVAHQYGQPSRQTICHAALLGRGGQAFYQRFCYEAGQWYHETQAASYTAAEIKEAMSAHPGDLVGSGSVLADGPTGDWLIDPVCVAECASRLDANTAPPDPLYLRAADAAVAKPVFPL